MIWLGLIVLIGLVAVFVRAFFVTLRTQPAKALILAGIVFIAIAFSVSVGDSSLGDMARSGAMERVLRMLATVAISVAVCIGLWILLNLAIAQAERRWPVFSGLTAATLGAIFFGLLRGNISVQALFAEPDAALFGAGAGFLGRLEWPLVGALLFGLGTFVAKSIPNLVARVAIGLGIGAVAGALIAPRTLLWQRPEINWVAAIGLAVVAAVIGGVLGNTQERRTRNVLYGAGVGFAAGGWLVSPFASIDTPWIVTIVPLALIMAGAAWISEPTTRERSNFDSRARVWIFLGPALSFLFIALVVPAFRTGVLSFYDRTSDEYVGIDNYERLFTASDSFDLRNWQNIFTSSLFYWTIILAVIGIAVALFAGTRRNGTLSWDSGPTSTGALLFALFLFSFAVLSTLRGTFFNNIWWVITVVTLTTGLGLAAAVLADRAVWGANLAKSLIFMPMAISFVGASIVWRLQFQAREVRKNQTGVLNAVWVALGKLSNSGWPRFMVMILLVLLLAWSLFRLVVRARAGLPFTGMSIVAFLAGWFLYRFAGPRLGGFRIGNDGEVIPETVQFITETPFNNVWLMVILIWLQTGFSMVIFYAAIKAVPQEYLEAAQVDGASDSQAFFGVTLPTIMPTVGVVVTTLIVLVTKVFDIVAVAGLGGKFGNNVLANEMFAESFQIQNIGLGAAIAIVLLLMVLPVMTYNVWTMQHEDA